MDICQVLVYPVILAVENITKISNTPSITYIRNTYIFITCVTYFCHNLGSDSIYWHSQTSCYLFMSHFLCPVTYLGHTSCVLLLIYVTLPVSCYVFRSYFLCLVTYLGHTSCVLLLIQVILPVSCYLFRSYFMCPVIYLGHNSCVLLLIQIILLVSCYLLPSQSVQ